MQKLMTWLATFPTTNGRIVLTLLLALATGVRVIGWGWQAPTEWLLFLGAWAGLDVAQFAAKRATYQAGGVS
jgi:hypothetical protein